MKDRILGEDGKFTDYTGPKTERYSGKSPEQKAAERKALEATAENSGFAPNNPVGGGLSKKDKEEIKAGKFSLVDLVTLATTRQIKLPKKISALGEISDFLLGESLQPAGSGISHEDREKLLAGISIPEMRKMARDHKVVIPPDTRKAVDIKNFLLKDDASEEINL